MRLPLRFQKPFVVEPLGPDDAETMSHVHAEGFARAWGPHEFAELMEQRTVFGYAARKEGDRELLGFVLARLAAGEGEILTIAVKGACRGRGLGWLLMDAVLRALHRERAEALFLEVDENNGPAVRLYRRLGFHVVGQRPRYYRENQGQPTNALVMRRDLS
ncbi:MAG TPA: ribosomal protein S18-alanine N-acetyltransferase [Mesorhizobium sp.]|jgi:ribosomal-protein-alanine N-acetyltransferase|nr:ribosomal protein S18-alanine N-acetyltransferase [Mesorhizobium sp.]